MLLLSPENVDQEELISMPRPWEKPFIADSILLPGIIGIYTKGLFRNLPEQKPQPAPASLPLPCPQLLFLDY